MKRLLLLGGSHFQVPSVITAVQMGYYVITCDYLPDNPGHKFSHEYYNISTTDKEAVLELVKKLKIDGIVCYASDPAATTAAYVAEQMGFPTSPYKSVEILANKDLFRRFLEDNGFNTPKRTNYTFPVVVKPVDSSGSKGVTVVQREDDIQKAVQYALQFSRRKKTHIEEFVEKVGYQIAGDGFSVNGKLVFRGFMNEHFEPGGLVPIGESFPYTKPKEIQQKIHNEVQRLLTLLYMGTQAYNFDIRINTNNDVELMEIGPRNGGCLIPQVIKWATGVDMVALTIKAALGEDCSYLEMMEPRGYWSTYMIHSQTEGILRAVWIDKKLQEKNIVEYAMIYKVGDKIPSYINSGGTLGTMILRFDSMDEMLTKMETMNEFVKVIL